MATVYRISWESKPREGGGEEQWFKPTYALAEGYDQAVALALAAHPDRKIDSISTDDDMLGLPVSAAPGDGVNPLGGPPPGPGSM